MRKSADENAPFQPGTDCARIQLQTVGGVLANSRNHPIGPTLATSSGNAFFRLYRYTGEALYLDVLQEIVTGLPQHLCYKPEQYLKQFWPCSRGGWLPEYLCSGSNQYQRHQRLRVGMMSEQYNMSDELSTRGDVWQINANWGPTGLLLSYGALPSIYVDRPRKKLTVFDLVEASADFDGRKLSVRNTTLYEAHLCLSTRPVTAFASFCLQGTERRSPWQACERPVLMRSAREGETTGNLASPWTKRYEGSSKTTRANRDLISRICLTGSFTTELRPGRFCRWIPAF